MMYAIPPRVTSISPENRPTNPSASRPFLRSIKKILLWMAAIPLGIAPLSLVGTPCFADEPPGAAEASESAEAERELVSYYEEIRPIFQTHCHGCHQPAKAGGEYAMTTHQLLLQGGESGEAAIVPGKSSESYLMDQITPEGGVAAMPQGADPLDDDQVALIARWIDEGAVDDSPLSTQRQFSMDQPPRYPAPPVITSLAFSPNGQLLAISGYHEVVLRSGDGRQILSRLVGMSERIESAVFSPDGQRLAVTGGSPGRFGEVQVWEVADPAQPELSLSLMIGHDTCYGASWSPDGSKIAFGCPDHSARAIDATSGEAVFYSGAHDDWVLDTSFSLEGDHLITVSRDMSMKLAHVETQRFIDNITSITPGALQGGINSVRRHPSAEQVAVGGADGTPKTYKIFREQDRKIGDDFNLIRAFAPMPGRIMAVTYNHDATQIAAGSSDSTSGRVHVYNEADGDLVSSISLPSGIYAVAFHPDGEVLAAGGFDGHVRLIRVTDAKVLEEFPPVPIDEEVAKLPHP